MDSATSRTGIPRIGVGVICWHLDFGIPWLRRHNTTHGNGQWSLPGGGLEFNETLVACAIRELREEFGLIAFADEMMRLGYISEDFFPEANMHWITHYYYTRIETVPAIMEPDKASEIGWSQSNEPPPTPLMIGAQEAVKWMNDNDAW